MGWVSEIFEGVANNGIPVMSPSVAATMPAGLPEMLTSTDMILNAEDITNLGKKGAANSTNAPTSSMTLEEIQASVSPQEFDNLVGLGGLGQAALEGAAAAFYFPDADGTTRDVGGVSANDPNTLKNYGQRALEIIPGTLDDWNTATYLHENAHLEDAKNGGLTNSRIQRELYGDSKGFQDYYRAYQKGVATDPEVPYAARAQRAIDVMENGNYGEVGPQMHSVNAIVPLPGEKYVGAQHTSNHAAGMAMLQARDDIHDQIGKDLYDLPDFNRLQIVNGMINNGMEMDPSLRQEVFRATAIPSFDATADAALVEKVTAQMTPEQKKFFEDSAGAWEKVGRDNAAQQAIQDQPGLLYETSKRMLQTGEFDNNPAGKKFVENYVDGVERYDPTRHGVAPEDRPTGRPEIVDQLAQQYAPRAEPVLQNSYAR